MPEPQRISSGSPYEPTIGFSRAIRVGDRVLVSGTGPIWPDGSCPDDAATQARRCLEIIEMALMTAGAQLSDVVRTRMFLTSAQDADAVGAAHGERFGATRPAATMVVVAALLDDRWKVEIEAEAVVPTLIRSLLALGPPTPEGIQRDAERRHDHHHQDQRPVPAERGLEGVRRVVRCVDDADDLGDRDACGEQYDHDAGEREDQPPNRPSHCNRRR